MTFAQALEKLQHGNPYDTVAVRSLVDPSYLLVLEKGILKRLIIGSRGKIMSQDETVFPPLKVLLGLWEEELVDNPTKMPL